MERTTDLLKKALENISSKTIPGNYIRIDDMLDAFNDLYLCKTTFTKTPATTTIVVYDNNGKVVESKNGVYYLAVGTYKYDASAEGYTSKVGESLTIASGDLTTGKTVTVTLTAEGE